MQSLSLLHPGTSSRMFFSTPEKEWAGKCPGFKVFSCDIFMRVSASDCTMLRNATTSGAWSSSMSASWIGSYMGCLDAIRFWIRFEYAAAVPYSSSVVLAVPGPASDGSGRWVAGRLHQA